MSSVVDVVCILAVVSLLIYCAWLRSHTGRAAAAAKELKSEYDELRHANAALKKQVDEQREAVQANAGFLANIGQELRSPLSSVLGMSELLKDTALTPDQLQLVKASDESACELLSVIRDLQDLAKLDREATAPESEPFKVGEVIREACAPCAESARRGKLFLNIDADPTIPETLIGDRHRLRQSLSQLLRNAVATTIKGGIILRATKSGETKDGVRVRFSVKDTGLGFTPEEQKTLFEPFQNSSSGLGLYLCRRTLDTMGGALQLESKKNAGTEISFELQFARFAPVDFGRRLPGERDQRMVALEEEYGRAARIFGPCDRSEAESAVGALYDLLHLPRPQFVWFDSPPEALRTIVLWDLMCAMLNIGTPTSETRLLFSADAVRKSQLSDRPVGLLNRFFAAATNSQSFDALVRSNRHVVPWEFGQTHAHESVVRNVTRNLFFAETPLDGWLDTWRNFNERIDSAIVKDNWERFADILWSLDVIEQTNLLDRTLQDQIHTNTFVNFMTLGNAFGLAFGPGDAHAMLIVDSGECPPSDPAMRSALRETIQKCGWWRPEESICFMIDRPVVQELDEFGRLHREIRYTDGYSLFAIHGIEVSENIARGKFSVADIESMNNVEVRRVMIEDYGAARYLQESGAEKVHEDNYGVLYRKPIQNDEPLVLVKVRNSTAEPDGSFKHYFLRVPPNINTAREAVAWSFDMKAKDYKPTKET